MEDFAVSSADLSSVDVDRILALRATSPEPSILMFAAKPERDAYLVVDRLAFAGDIAPKSAGVAPLRMRSRKSSYLSVGAG